MTGQTVLTDGGEEEWPKPWSEIKPPVDDQIHFHVASGHMQFMDGMRGFEGTLYVSVDVGDDTEENRDLWMPFRLYIERAAGGGLE